MEGGGIERTWSSQLLIPILGCGQQENGDLRGGMRSTEGEWGAQKETEPTEGEWGPDGGTGSTEGNRALRGERGAQKGTGPSLSHCHPAWATAQFHTGLWLPQ